MFKHYIRGYLRTLLRNRFITFINIAGLIIGLSGCFIMLLFVLHEITMDHFQENRKSVYRVQTTSGSFHHKSGQASYLFGPAAKQEFPEVKEFARIIRLQMTKIKKGNQLLEEEGVCFADPAALQLLSFHFISGDPVKAIDDYSSILLSRSMALKYFGEENPLGKMLTFHIKGEELVLHISGIFDDLPENSSMKIDFLGNLDFGKKQLIKMLYSFSIGITGPQAPFKDSWDHTFYTNLIQLRPNTDIKNLESRINKQFKKYTEQGDAMTYSFQRFDQIYLHSEDIENDEMKHGNIKNIWIFGTNAILILIIACFNYLILSLAQSEKRAKEIGIRKASGAGFKNLTQQVILESFTFALICLPLAIGLSELLLPLINKLLDKHLVIYYSQNLIFLTGILLITILISLFSGLYLSLYLQKFNPIEILRGRKTNSGTHSYFLKSLVILQIAIFIGLIISSLTIFSQLEFIRNFDTGFKTQNVLILSLEDELAKRNSDQLMQAIGALPEVRSQSRSMLVPPSSSRFNFNVGKPDNPSEHVNIEMLPVDFGFPETMGIQIKEGHAFSKDYPSDSAGVILNEAAVQELGLKEPLGSNSPFGKVIAIAKNFHIHDLHSKITPAFIILNPQYFHLILKTKTDPVRVIPKLEKIWKSINPDIPFKCQSLEESIADQYKSERRFSAIILLFTILAILVASLGLIGLSGFITLRRTKEIGIRKVHGATVFEMMMLFWREIFIWTLLAFLLASPIAWYLMHSWLQSFEYKTPLSWRIFAESGALALLIALASVSWQIYKLTRQNPVKALRYE